MPTYEAFQPAARPGCCKACWQSSVLMLARMLVLMLMLVTSTTTTSNLVLVLTTSTRVDLFNQIFSHSCCIFTLLALLNQPTIVLLYPCLKIRLLVSFKVD